MFSNLFKELEQIKHECSCFNWDGYDANPINLESYSALKQILIFYDFNIYPTNITIENDGKLAIEWYKNNYNIISLLIESSNKIYYYMFINQKMKHGTITYKNFILPKKIKSYIKKFYFIDKIT
jgi:hypothetical protein